MITAHPTTTPAPKSYTKSNHARYQREGHSRAGTHLCDCGKPAVIRSAIIVELNPEYITFSEQRTDVTPGLALA